ncbi:HOOK protein-domain-containing protein [Geopyxis carbonaria]|nr:HOOK protein-domain-containing protein [Geopyxis carbonaria]
MQEMIPSSQTEIMGLITQMMELDEGEDPEDLEGKVETMDDLDQFRMEEEMARIAAEKEAIESKYKSMEKQMKLLQHDFDDSQSELLRLQDQMAGGMADRSYANRTDPMVRSQIDQLQSDVQKLEDLVSEKENTITSQENKIAQLKRQTEDLLPKAEAGMKYKDDLDEAHHTIERLRKTQNVAEKYRKKLEGMGELERQVKTLEEQNAQMLQDLRAGEDNSKQVPGLRRTVEQYKKQIEKLEAECADALRAKHAFEQEKDILREKAAGAESQKNKDMEQIQILEEKVRELESGVISKASGEMNGDLNSELNYTTKTKTDLKLNIARLENEIAHLKEGGGAGADNVVLQHMLEDARKARDKLEQDYLQANTERLVLESQLAAIRSGAAGEGSEILLKLRQNMLDVEKNLSDINRKHSETIAELEITKRALLSAQTDLSLVDKSKLEALSELKSIASSDLADLQLAHEDLQSKLKDAEFEIEQKKGLLNTVLLDKDEISQKLSASKDQVLEKEQALSELKSTIAAFEGSAEGRDAALEKRCTQLQSKLEDRRERMTKSKEHIKKQNVIIKELKEQLEAAVKADGDEKLKAMEEKLAEVKARTEEKLAIVEREKALIATAYHDQSSRLQMNSVMLLRRNDAPVSWLNKQRSAINRSVKK